MIIAVDFDGTIVEHKYPEIGQEVPVCHRHTQNAYQRSAPLNTMEC